MSYDNKRSHDGDLGNSIIVPYNRGELVAHQGVLEEESSQEEHATGELRPIESERQELK